MKSNKIEGIKPFNDLFYKSCFYNQLLSALSAFNIDKDEVILSFYTEIYQDFLTKEIDLNKIKEFKRSRSYKDKKININKKRIIKFINKKQVMIVGVDCFYLESKPETYQKAHDPHFILVYGYDLDKDEVNVIDHAYRNDYDYKEKIISFSNLLLANKMFKKINNKRTTARLIYPNNKKINSLSTFNYLNSEILLANKSNAIANLEEIKNLIINNLDELLNKVSLISNYLSSIKIQYFLFSKSKYFEDNIEKENIITALVNAYSNILSLFWKTGYQNNTLYIDRYKDNVIRKIYEIIELEKEIYVILLEFLNYDLSQN